MSWDSRFENNPGRASFQVYITFDLNAKPSSTADTTR